MMIVVAPTFSTDVVQTLECEMDDEVSEQAIRDHVVEWLKAAKQMEGGEDSRVVVFVGGVLLGVSRHSHDFGIGQVR